MSGGDGRFERLAPDEQLDIPFVGAVFVLLANVAHRPGIVNRAGSAVAALMGDLHQLIDEGQHFNVVVDYAFTPNSFEKVFDYAESITDKDHRIIAVFGASGDRDHNRRPGTATVADKRADLVILSYDDPSTEDMMEILVDLKSYFKKLDPEIILDRIEAIRKAIDLAQDGDTILLLGKGSDKFFLCKEGRVPYISDEAAARIAIREKLKGNA